MKKLFKSFLVGGLSITAASALFVGVGSTKEAVEVDAATATTLYLVADKAGLMQQYSISDSNFKIYLNVNFSGNSDQWSDGNDGRPNAFLMSQTDKTYNGVPIFTVSFTDLYDGLGAIQFQIKDNSTWKAQVQPFGNYQWRTPDVYNNKMWVYSGGTSFIDYQDDTMVTHTISKFAVVDGTVEGTRFGYSTVEHTSTYEVPADIKRAQYIFGGWYSDDKCTTAYTAQTIVSDINIYAKFTSYVNDSYVYYVTGSQSVTTHYIYSFGGDGQFKDDTNAGVPITSVRGVAEVHGDVRFQGVSQLIYKIPYSTSAGDTHLIITTGAWGDSNQTSDLLLVSHSAYWWSKDTDYHNDEAGAALDYILGFESIRNKVSEDSEKGIKSTSICGINEDDATDLVDDYNKIDATTRANYIDNSTTSTYRMGGYYSDLDNVSFRDMLEELAALWELNLNEISNVGRIVSAVGGNATLTSNTLVIILITSAAVITLGGVFILRRKEN